MLALTVTVCTEPAAALVHRLVMHRSGWRWHRSHHRSLGRGIERNDLFPVCFATVTVILMAVGALFRTGPMLVVGAGVTAYGAAYATVHDVCLHGRMTGRPFLRGRYLHWLSESHEVHHRFGKAPYGFLVPIVPKKHRTATATFAGVATRARVRNTS